MTELQVEIEGMLSDYEIAVNDGNEELANELSDLIGWYMNNFSGLY